MKKSDYFNRAGGALPPAVPPKTHLRLGLGEVVRIFDEPLEKKRLLAAGIIKWKRTKIWTKGGRLRPRLDSSEKEPESSVNKVKNAIAITLPLFEGYVVCLQHNDPSNIVRKVPKGRHWDCASQSGVHL